MPVYLQDVDNFIIWLRRKLLVLFYVSTQP